MNAEVVERTRLEANAQLDPLRKGELGQFMTPYGIAEFMASLFGQAPPEAVLLDAGAGVGSLTMAASKVLRLDRAEVWEVDAVMRRYLAQNLGALSCPLAIHALDFIEDAVNMLQFNMGTRFTHAILNPPYKKIQTGSKHRLLLRQAGIETVNLYTAFLALSILLLRPGGQLVAIVPRSFCNGPYYKPFRALMLRECAVDHIHVFDSRSTAFKDDGVLQENIILKLTRGKPQGDVTISRSSGEGLEVCERRVAMFPEIVKGADPEYFIHIPTSALDDTDVFNTTLSTLGLSVRTGPVVDFRLKPWLVAQPGENTVPLIYPHHHGGDGFAYPRVHKKANALQRCPEVEKWLMPNEHYVLVKRFSAKEERRRVVAYVHVPSSLNSDLVGFENHWNVFHVGKRGMDEVLARGLACFLNSTLLDSHFRMFSGHTQVNATDLRNIKYPTLAQLLALGRHYRSGLSQAETDALLDAAST